MGKIYPSGILDVGIKSGSTQLKLFFSRTLVKESNLKIATSILIFFSKKPKKKSSKQKFENWVISKLISFSYIEESKKV
jgi:hypothetical protein